MIFEHLDSIVLAHVHCPRDGDFQLPIRQLELLLQPAILCPVCGHVIDSVVAVTPIDDDGTDEGDVDDEDDDE